MLQCGCGAVLEKLCVQTTHHCSQAADSLRCWALWSILLGSARAAGESALLIRLAWGESLFARTWAGLWFWLAAFLRGPEVAIVSVVASPGGGAGLWPVEPRALVASR